MRSDKKTENSEKKVESRRKFLKNAGKAAVVVPAAGIILNASEAQAQACVGSGCLLPD